MKTYKVELDEFSMDIIISALLEANCFSGGQKFVNTAKVYNQLKAIEDNASK